MRSSDIAARCREIALRVQCSGEWGELGETLTQAATEVERLRLVGSDSQILKRAAQLMCDHEPHFLFSINSMLGVADKLDGKSVALDVERTGGGE